MKKKVLFLVTMIAAAIFLVSCSSTQQASLDGEYYVEYDGKLFASPWVVIKGKTLTYYSGGKDKPSGTVIYSIDTEKRTLTGENQTQSYSYKDGVLSAKLGANTSVSEYYSKSSKKYKELEKYEKD